MKKNYYWFAAVQLNKRFNKNTALWDGVLYESVETLQEYHEEVWSNLFTGEPYILPYDMLKTCPAGCEPENYDLTKFLLEHDCPYDKNIVLRIKGL